MALILGIILSLAWLPLANVPSRIGFLPPDQRDRILAAKVDEQLRLENARMAEEVSKIREEKTRLENAIGDQTKQTKVLNEGLQDTKLLAGLTDVEGPGIVITLKDSEKATRGGIPEAELVIHDVDILKVVNELWAAGAEAISVNEVRLIGRSSIRCAGPIVYVGNVQVSSPVRIKAIGDPETLYGGLNIRLGVLDEIRNSGDPSMVQIEKAERLTLKAFTGSTGFRFLKPVEEAK